MRKREKKSKKKYIIASLIAGFIIIIAFFAVQKIENITCEGNERLTEEELKSQLLGGSHDDNTIVFFVKTKFGGKKQIPFVEDYDIEIKGLNSIKVTVYEKSIVGYVSYMGTCMYFDKDGIVVENSSVVYEDVPQITGIKFDNIVVHEKIPVENKKVFKLIMDITQLVDKHDIQVKKINVSEELDVTLFIGNYRVALGNEGENGKKIAALADAIPKIQDIPGELDMRTLDTKGTGYVFKKDR